jgi:hypothetical protein
MQATTSQSLLTISGRVCAIALESQGYLPPANSNLVLAGRIEIYINRCDRDPRQQAGDYTQLQGAE